MPLIAGAADDLGDQPRLAHAGVGDDGDDLSAPFDGDVEPRERGGQLVGTTDHRQAVLDQPQSRGPSLVHSHETRGGDRSGLALHGERSDVVPGEGVAGGLAHRLVDDDLVQRRELHQPRRQVHGVAEHAVAPPGDATEGAGSGAALGDADLHLEHRRHVQRAQLERGGDGAHGVVAVGDRCAERGVEVAALVADRDLQDVALEAGQDRLHLADERVELVGGVVVAVVVDAVEAQEQRHRRPELGEELAHARRRAGRPPAAAARGGSAPR